MDSAQLAASKALEGWKLSRQVLEGAIAQLRADKAGLQTGYYSMRLGIDNLKNVEALNVIRSGQGATQSCMIGIGIATDGIEKAMYSVDVLFDDIEALLKAGPTETGL